MRRPRRFLSVVVSMGLAVAAVGVGAVGPSPVSAASGLGAGGEYHPINPRVVLDARDGSSAGPIDAPLASSPKGKRISLRVTGVGAVPADPAEVLAVAVNIRVDKPSASGDLVAFAAGMRSIPGASSLTFQAKRTTSNLVFVRPDATGSISIALRSDVAGTASVRAVVVGWISTSSSATRGSRLITTVPRRLFDSASNTLTGGEVVELSVRGVGNVPDDATVEAAVLNVTLMNTRAKSKRTALAAVTNRPTSEPRFSFIAAGPGQTTSNVVIVPVDANGDVHLYNKAGYTDAVVDLVGYTKSDMQVGSRRGRIVPLDKPFRSFDTRRSQFGSVPLGPGQAEEWDYAPFVASLSYPETGAQVGPITTVLGTLSAVEHHRQYPANPPSTTDLRIYPSKTKLPTMSNLVLAEDQRTSNMLVGRLSDNDRLKAYNKNGTTHYILDISAIVLEGTS